jgi:hypothetical protein
MSGGPIILEQLPEYRRATRRGAALEEHWRDNAFLGLDEKICGITVRAITLRMFLRLCRARSPFLCPGRIRPGHVAQFLWHLSPKHKMPHERGYKRARQAFADSIARLDYRTARRAIFRYIWRHFMDRPPSKRARKSEPASVSIAAAIIHALAKSYGWNDEEILDKPMARIYQYIIELRTEHARDAKQPVPTFTPVVSRLRKRVLKRLDEKDTPALDPDPAPDLSGKTPC